MAVASGPLGNQLDREVILAWSVARMDGQQWRVSQCQYKERTTAGSVDAGAAPVNSDCLLTEAAVGWLRVQHPRVADAVMLATPRTTAYRCVPRCCTYRYVPAIAMSSWGTRRFRSTCAIVLEDWCRRCSC